MKSLTDSQWHEIADHADMPVELAPGVDGQDFYVYDREYGYFPVACGHHELVMSHLFAYRQGFATFFDYVISVNGEYTLSNLADKWLELPGTCFFSSQGHYPSVWHKSNLNYFERKNLGPEFREVGD